MQQWLVDPEIAEVSLSRPQSKDFQIETLFETLQTKINGRAIVRRKRSKACNEPDPRSEQQNQEGVQQVIWEREFNILTEENA